MSWAVWFVKFQLPDGKPKLLSPSPPPPFCLLPYSEYKNFLVSKRSLLPLSRDVWSARIWLKSASVPPPTLFPLLENWQSWHFSDISKQLRLFLPTPSCSLNLSNPVECKLIYWEEGARPGLAAGARNVRVGKMINIPATENGRDITRLSTIIRLFNVQR